MTGRFDSEESASSTIETLSDGAAPSSGEDDAFPPDSYLEPDIEEIDEKERMWLKYSGVEQTELPKLSKLRRERWR